MMPCHLAAVYQSACCHIAGDETITNLPVKTPNHALALCFHLQGNLNYQLKEKDNIMFISTLHGG
jgi:hypothetical protein